MRRENNNNENNTRRNEDLKRIGGGRLKHYNVDGDVLCHYFCETFASSSSKKNSKERMLSGSNMSNSMKDGSRSKMTSGSKDVCGDSTRKGNDEKANNNDVTFIVLQRNMRSMHSSERIEEMVCEFEGYRWDAILLSETWRPAKSEIWETHHKHIIMGAGKYDNKHGVGIMLNKRWRKRIIDTEYINERATILVNRQHIKPMSVYFPHSGYADHHVEKCTEQSRMKNFLSNTCERTKRQVLSCHMSAAT